MTFASSVAVLPALALFGCQTPKRSADDWVAEKPCKNVKMSKYYEAGYYDNPEFRAKAQACIDCVDAVSPNLGTRPEYSDRAFQKCGGHVHVKKQGETAVAAEWDAYVQAYDQLRLNNREN